MLTSPYLLRCKKKKEKRKKIVRKNSKKKKSNSTYKTEKIKNK